MNDPYYIILAVFLLGAIISEVMSILFFRRILSFYDKDPEEVLEDKVLRILSFFSLSYLIAVMMLLFSGVERFQFYGLIISTISLVELFVRKVELGRYYRVMVGTALTLILLIDSVRQISKNFL